MRTFYLSLEITFWEKLTFDKTFTVNAKQRNTSFVEKQEVLSRRKNKGWNI